MGKKFDMSEGAAYLVGVGMIGGAALVDETDQQSATSAMFVGTSAGLKFKVEPRFNSTGVYPHSLDALTRMVVITTMDGTMDGSAVLCHPQVDRTGGAGWINIGDSAGYALQHTTGSLFTEIYVTESPLPTTLFNDAYDGTDIDDFLLFRVDFEIDAASTGEVECSCTVILMPGPLNSTQNPPRGFRYGTIADF